MPVRAPVKVVQRLMLFLQVFVGIAYGIYNLVL